MQRAARLRSALVRPVDAASLAAFRVLLGGVLLLSVVRSLQKGVVAQGLLAPQFFFTHYGFAWLPPPGALAYLIYGVLGMLSLCLVLGVYTRLAAGLFCLLFSYLHLVDLTHYLNHYYLVTLLTALLAVVPIGEVACLTAGGGAQHVPSWVLALFRFQIGVVYFFGGVAKLKHDWLFAGEPLRTWLAANTEVPLLGALFATRWAPYLMSWLGAIYDLSVPFALSWRRTRPLAYAAVVFFHLITARLFQIGIFPYLMMAGSTLFFAPDWPRRALRRPGPLPTASARSPLRRWQVAAMSTYVALQLLAPLRHFLYPGNMLWTEQGFRFAWHVMLIEKTGSAEFTLVDRRTAVRRTIFPRTILTRAQDKAMATQPDMILAFAHELARRESVRGREVAVYADVLVSLNGRTPRRLIDPAVDLSREREGFAPKRWILPGP